MCCSVNFGIGLFQFFYSWLLLFLADLYSVRLEKDVQMTKWNRQPWSYFQGIFKHLNLITCYSWVCFSSSALLPKCFQEVNVAPFKHEQHNKWHNLPILSRYLIIFQIQAYIQGFIFSCYLVINLDKLPTVKSGLWATFKLVIPENLLTSVHHMMRSRVKHRSFITREIIILCCTACTSFSVSIQN